MHQLSRIQWTEKQNPPQKVGDFLFVELDRNGRLLPVTG
jgi:hypothetical protein